MPSKLAVELLYLFRIQHEWKVAIATVKDAGKNIFHGADEVEGQGVLQQE